MLHRTLCDLSRFLKLVEPELPNGKMCILPIKTLKKKKKVPKKKKCKKAKRLSEVALQVAENRSKRQRRKGKIYPSECRDPKIARRDRKAFLSDQCKEIEENNRMRMTRDPLEKIGDTKGTFHAKWAQ